MGKGKLDPSCQVGGRLNESSHVFTGGGGTGTWLFGYNPASQMISRTVTNDSHVWTGAVNVNRNCGVNGLNQYTSAGPATFTYDPDGNLTGDGRSSGDTTKVPGTLY